MKISYDASVDAAYMSFAKADEASVFGFTYCCNPAEVEGEINLDFDASGRLIGLEILQASKKLPISLFTELQARKRANVKFE